MEICKILIESGYFFLSNRKPWFPHRRAVWGNRIFLRGPAGTDWGAEALRFRDWICEAQGWYSQVVLLRYCVRVEPLPNIRPQDMDWGMGNPVWDVGRGPWPDDPVYPAPPYAAYTGQRHRGLGWENVPLPPSVAYRWERHTPTLGGRKHYGYLRYVERQVFRGTSLEAGNCLPFFFAPSRLAWVHTRQIATPLATTGADAWHTTGNPVREIVISHRGGSTSVHEVEGYSVGVAQTTARNFTLPVL